jgi:GTP-binding protein HflX
MAVADSLLIPTATGAPRAILVGVLVPGRPPEQLQSSLDELGRLCDTLGFEVVGRMTQRRGSTRAIVLLGEGRLRALAEWTGGSGAVHRGPQKTKRDEAREAGAEAEEEDEQTFEDTSEDEQTEGPGYEAHEAVTAEGAPVHLREGRRADVVVVDHELSPSQLRNLKSATGVEVLDRTGVIIEIFHKRAKSREARLQVELARLAYLAPRLRELGGPSERQRGGIGGKGAGETDIEMDRRKVRDRMSELRHELAALDTERSVRRSRRKDARQVALVGYTNAGKSSLMRALTGAQIYVADQLFATLDTTVRRLVPELMPPVLVTDTVGFIQDLPHSLVASFRSTLEAAIDAGLLLQVVDVADPSWRVQEAVTREVLEQIDAGDLPRRLVFNKCDKLDPAVEEALRIERPDAWFTAAHSPSRVADLHHRIAEHFGVATVEVELLVPWAKGALTGRVHAEVEVLSTAYIDEGTVFRVRGPETTVERLQQALR